MRRPAELGRGWVRPWWLEHGAEPAATIVGNLASPGKATVDPGGLVTPWPDGWSLDWWIGADDRWHVPSREVAVRQRLVESSPVVETAMRVPTGDAIHRAYAVRTAGDGHELVVVEIENRSTLPFAVAIAVRPYTSRRIGTARRIAIDGTTVTVNGRVAMLLPKPPARAVASTLTGGDSARKVLAGEAPAQTPAPVRCRSRLAQAAFVYPLAHTATLRVLLPLLPAREPVAVPTTIPPATAVARGWAAHSRHGLQVELPDGSLAEAVEAARRSLMLVHHDDRTGAALALFGLAVPRAWARPEAVEQGRITAELLTRVRTMLVREVPGSEPHLALCAALPDTWRGRPVEAHDAPTEHGTLSFAVRWHGPRPALLWELRDAARPVRLSAPALDPGWSTRAPSGEALLAPSPGIQTAPEESFG